MKTIPVSSLLAGLLLPAVCIAQPQKPNREPRPMNEEGKGHHEGPEEFLKTWNLADTDKDGFLSLAEFKEMTRVKNLPVEKQEGLFKRLDKNADGKLSREEILQLRKNHAGPGKRDRLWELDTDKSGGISFEEFKLGPLFQKLSPEKQKEVFTRLDTDGDGFITPKDRPNPSFKRPEGNKPRPNRPEGPPNDEAMPGRINRKLDTNGDGALSFEEFRLGPAVKNLTEDEQEDRFDALDRNKDLKISEEDFPPPADAPKN